jgi:hypothetical protein
MPIERAPHLPRGEMDRKGVRVFGCSGVVKACDSGTLTHYIRTDAAFTTD